MLKHTVAHRSNSSLGSCSLPYTPCHQQSRRSSLAARPYDGTVSAQCSPMPSKTRDLTGFHRKVNSARSFVELVNLIDSYPSLIDFDADDTISEASFGAPASLPPIGHASKPPTGRAESTRPMTLPRKGDFKDFRRPSLNSVDSFTSLQSSISCSSLNSSQTLVGSKTNSTDSLSETIPVKVFMKRLRPDIEYKTLALTSSTTCRQMIHSLLTKFRLRHRDPNLFFVTMEVSVDGPDTTKRALVLDDDARPAELQQCHPKGDSRFSIGVRRGGLIRVHDSILMPGSQYKSLMIAYNTNADELVQLLLKCYNNHENPKHFALHEVSRQPYHDRPIPGEDCPLAVQSGWPSAERSNKSFVLRRNLVYTFNLKSRMTWRRSVDQSDTESDLDVTKSSDTRGSSISSSSSVSSNCSSHSSESSIDSGYLGSPIKELRKPLDIVKDQPPPLPKRNESIRNPIPLPPPKSSIPMTPTVSKLATVCSTPVSSTPKKQTTVITITGKTIASKYPKRTLVPVKPPFRKLPELPTLKPEMPTSTISPLATYNEKPTFVNRSEMSFISDYITEPHFKPKIISEIPKPSDRSATLPNYPSRRLPRIPPRCSRVEPRIIAEIRKSTPKSSATPPSQNYRSFSANSASSNAEKEFLDAIESIKTLSLR